MLSPAQSKQHWRERASNARAVAEWMENPEVRRLLREVAERYERIAVFAQSGNAQFTTPDHHKEELP